MMPSIELRLATMRRALAEVILPAIAADNALAREQTQLVMAHLDLLAQQLPSASRLDERVLRGTEDLARTLAANASGGARTQAATAALGAALETNEDASHAARRARLAAAIDVLVGAAEEDGEAAFRARVYDAIVAHASEYGVYERAWFAPNGLDPERASLPPLATLFAAE
ncbi:MAG: hypothetical protein AB7I01_13420 [Gammaproteobacteria bacterium]